MKLSKRLELVASFVEKGSRIADVGTDHGYIPIYLVESGIAQWAAAMDIRSGPLERARTHVAEHKLTDCIDIRLSDGVKALMPDEADSVIIAGMGGELIIHILDEGKHLWSSVKEWILSPQSDLQSVRSYLAENGFLIVQESMLEEEGKYYTVMKAVRGSMRYEKASYYRYGRNLIKASDKVLERFLHKEKSKLLNILNHMAGKNSSTAAKREEQIRLELIEIEEVLNEMCRDN